MDLGHRLASIKNMSIDDLDDLDVFRGLVRELGPAGALEAILRSY